MGKTFENYDKRTFKDVMVEFLKAFGWGLLGAIIGAIPYFVLHFVGYNSVLLFMLCGAGAMVFYAAFGKSEVRRAGELIALVLSTLVGAFVTLCTYLLTTTLPSWNCPDENATGVFSKLAYLFSHSRPDTIRDGKVLIDAYGSFSIWTVLISAFIFSLIGLFVAFIFVVISRNRKSKK